MGGLLGQASRLALGAVVAATAAVGVWLYNQQPPAAPAPPPVAEAAAPLAAPAAAPSVADPAPAELPTPMVDRLAPTLDVVRVESDGSATVAGLAEAGARVSLRIDDVEAAFATADGAGNFASLFTLPESQAPRVLTVLSKATDGHEVLGTSRVILAPTAGVLAAPTIAEPTAEPTAEPPAVAAAEPPAAEQPPVAAPATAPAPIIKIDDSTSAAVLMDAPEIENITVDTITYQGDIIRVAGRGAAGSMVRLYLDNADVATATIAASGTFIADLSGVAPGDYTLRADQLDGAGQVTSRYEVAITKAAPQALADAAPAPTVVQVAAGTTLWAIAKAQFGDGLMYVQVYEANKDQIRDPDLIYPGQVFEIPAQP